MIFDLRPPIALIFYYRSLVKRKVEMHVICQYFDKNTRSVIDGGDYYFFDTIILVPRVGFDRIHTRNDYILFAVAPSLKILS